MVDVEEGMPTTGTSSPLRPSSHCQLVNPQRLYTQASEERLNNLTSRGVSEVPRTAPAVVEFATAAHEAEAGRHDAKAGASVIALVWAEILTTVMILILSI